MKKNSVYVGSVKDTDEIWHPMIVSPDEDLCHKICQKIVDNIEEGSFFTDIYTVEIVAVVVPSVEAEEDTEDDSWFQFSSWEECDVDDLFDASTGEMVLE